MKSHILTGGLLALGLWCLPVLAADDDGLTRLALCQDSWAEWSKTDPDKLKAFGEHFRAAFAQHGNDAFAVPKRDVSVMGLRVTQAYPESVGMGVGFSLTVDATFDAARKAVEKGLGKALRECETGEGMRHCGLEVARQRTVMLMAEDKPASRHTLLGCYYFYEK